jgi:hypothetical protein
MEKQVTMQRSYSAMIIVGFLSIGISFLIYTKYDYAAVTKEMVPYLERIAVAMYIVLFMSFGAIGWIV